MNKQVVGMQRSPSRLEAGEQEPAGEGAFLFSSVQFIPCFNLLEPTADEETSDRGGELVGLGPYSEGYEHLLRLEIATPRQASGSPSALPRSEMVATEQR